MNSYHTPIGLPVSVWLATLPGPIVKNTPMIVWTYLQRLTWPQLIAGICFPVFVLKQFINVVQFYKASKHLADSDREERVGVQFSLNFKISKCKSANML